MTALLDQLTAAATAAAVDAGGRQVLEVPLNRLEPDPDQPRRTFAETTDRSPDHPRADRGSARPAPTSARCGASG